MTILCYGRYIALFPTEGVHSDETIKKQVCCNPRAPICRRLGMRLIWTLRCPHDMATPQGAIRQLIAAKLKERAAAGVDMDDDDEEVQQNDLAADDFFAAASDTQTPSQKRKEARGDSEPVSEKRRRIAERSGTDLTAQSTPVSRVSAKKPAKAGVVDEDLEAEALTPGRRGASESKKRRTSTGSEVT
jgi:hypothetical protein